MTRDNEIEVVPFHIDPPGAAERVIRGRVVGPPGWSRRGHAARAHPHVIVLHGFKGFMDWGFFPELARRIAARGMCACCFNFSGSGIGDDPLNFTEHEAFAHNTYTRELEDVASVRAHLRSGAIAGLDPERAALLGHSRGGGIALLHAAEDEGYEAVVTWAAIDDVDRFDEETKAAWREQGYISVPNARTGQVHRIDLDALHDVEHNRERLDIAAACARSSTPTLLVHGAADEAVPISALERLAAAFEPGRVEVLRLPEAGHTFGVGHPFEAASPDWERVVDASLEHLGRHLGVA